MAILIGIESQHASGSSHTSDGYGGFSIDTNSMDVIKDGTKEELIEYVKEHRKDEAFARKSLNKLEDELEYSNISQEEYEKLYDKYTQMLFLTRFSKLMILEGEIL